MGDAVGYDVIVVGARVAGAATALLLARRGLRVLTVDRAAFPSDTLSSHQIQPPGVERLARWGLLDRLGDAPPTHRVRLDSTATVLDGTFPGGGAIHSPRRTLLDHALVEAARAAGAEVRERWRVEDLVWEDGRVAGVRGGSAGGQLRTERAPLVVGADGKRSFVAQAVRASARRHHAPRSFASYTYWAGVPLTAGELHQREGLAAAAFPTNGGLTMVYMSAPLAGFDAFRADAEAGYLAALDRCGDLGDRVRAGTRAERLRTTPDLPGHVRAAHGPGWCLVGDAGVTMDPVSAQGIANALRDAEGLATAIADGLGGVRPLRAALADHERDRDRALRPMYDFTLRLATYHSGPAERLFLRAVARRRDPATVERVFGAFAGTVPVDEVFGARGALRLAAAGFAAGIDARLRTEPSAR
ncbi:NAD(P)/FAD-dependent oxidoreductase [Phytohabitans suffuscus]|uniref:FAD-dependent oxidoreductase n=1 Tax=Phytohabitans suffuscus TaxID=624315 RepID=A0A6F8YYV5_9ACTN|nr:FAD-dependent monooxygenase [Phytohabitans suffuscus]BCB91262.1 FAD-dependent oxidoreductase [Phytohabitans suffuscus]